MKICFPVQSEEGLKSVVFGHFGSAPAFVVVDTGSGEVSVIANPDRDHAHGACSPMRALDGRQVDVIVVGGIGAGALSKLNRMGIEVRRAQAATVEENLALHAAGALPLLTLEGCCGGHRAGGGCAH